MHAGCGIEQIPGESHPVPESVQREGGETFRMCRIGDVPDQNGTAPPGASEQKISPHRGGLNLSPPDHSDKTGIPRIGTIQDFRSVNPFCDKHIRAGNGKTGCQFRRIKTGHDDRFFRPGNIQDPKSVFPCSEIEELVFDPHLPSARDPAAAPYRTRVQRFADIVDRHSAPSACIKILPFPCDCRTAPRFRDLAEFQFSDPARLRKREAEKRKQRGGSSRCKIFYSHSIHRASPVFCVLFPQFFRPYRGSSSRAPAKRTGK